MKNRKGIMALEGLETQEPEIADTPLAETTPLEIDNEVQGLNEQFDQLDEAEGIAETVGTITDGLEETIQDVTAEDGAVTPGEGVDELTAEVTNAALEHFYNRVGIQRKPGQKTVSLEGFGVAKTRLKNTQVAVENLKSFQKKLAASIQVAQESLLDSISNRIESSSKQLDDILASLSKVSKDFDSKGAKEGAVTGGKWAASFGGFDSQGMVMGKDVVERLKEIDALFKKNQAAEVVVAMSGVMVKLIAQMGKEKGSASTFGPQPELQRKLDQLADGTAKIKKVISAIKPSGDSQSFAPITASEKAEAVKAVQSIGAQLSDFSKAWERLEEHTEDLKAAADKAENSKETKGEEGHHPIAGRVWGMILGLPFAGVGAIIGFLVGSRYDEKNAVAATAGTKESELKGQAAGAKKEAIGRLTSIIEVDAELVKLCYAAVTYVEKSTA